MIEKMHDFIGRLLFGRNYKEGFAKKETMECKDKYILTSIFPNKQVMNQVNELIQKEGKVF